MAMPGLRTLLAASFVLAVLSVTPWIVGDPAILFSVFIAGPAWLVLAVVILAGAVSLAWTLGTLIGLPFALSDTWHAALIVACTRGRMCL